eukprot:CAMPEP_0115336102 /NCGR_PEP_ID=MMETSP0270-20121206/88822_1 /TAXON_ID=71861 /ORGANISM="Scrippsiella trochoidea, Strain CCMP3099" /LENGTH=65 /DNA_ID=CAMNT_0002757243 /DNA_START=96 /DNA_END=290 /DNA_ORIENTATION=-
MANQTRALLTMFSTAASHTAPSTLASHSPQISTAHRGLTRCKSQQRAAASLAARAHQPRPSHGRL